LTSKEDIVIIEEPSEIPAPAPASAPAASSYASSFSLSGFVLFLVAIALIVIFIQTIYKNRHQGKGYEEKSIA
jgi:hypothetical protein